MDKAEDDDVPERWHALVAIDEKRKLKWKAMTKAEAERRNATIKELGLEWVLCERLS